ncbi:porin [Photobacterium sp. DNB23_23_1]|uniref:Porin n=1 Tax=Photobacterium pectinilyticum TaxID=2906793 RepID=A0ABT1N7Q3_9GAMM|nr:porin [Photobacterium sp. ZSDE20]MCQ1059726.1 porin [Photobacterium sp. ZSDE20]MDD1825932.1 porin [Photobacterium sp. ZSDE20]
MNKKLIALAVAAAAASPVHALEVYNDGTNTFSVGGRLAASARFSDGDSELRNQSSRINFSYTHALESGWDIGTRAEWGYDALANNNEDSLLSNRLGQITADKDGIGHFTIGKAWSVNYDLTGRTDMFWIYGGEAAGNYDGISSDGGVHGTGRADDVIQYRNNFNGLQVGLQYQFEDNNDDYERESGYQAMINYDFDFGFGVGAAYTQTKFDDREDAKIANFGLSYNANNLNIAANYNEFRNHQVGAGNGYGGVFADGDLNTVGGTIKSATGTEVFVSYDINSFQILGGYNHLEDDNSDAKYAYGVIGAAYFTGPLILAAEYKIDASSTNGNGSDANLDNELGLLVRYNF